MTRKKKKKKLQEKGKKGIVKPTRPFNLSSPSNSDRPTSLIDCVFVGDGIVQGPAYKYASEYPDHRVVVVEPADLYYEPLKNMEIVQKDAIAYFRGLTPESVREVKDDFSFDWVILEVANPDIAEQLREKLEIYRKARYLRDTKGGSQDLPNTHRNTLRYLNGVSHALVEGGRFVLTTTYHSLKKMEDYLGKSGFLVERGLLDAQEIIALGSSQALQAASEGKSIYEVVATKPSEGILQERAQKEERRTQQERKRVARERFLRGTNFLQ